MLKVTTQTNANYVWQTATTDEHPKDILESWLDLFFNVLTWNAIDRPKWTQNSNRSNSAQVDVAHVQTIFQHPVDEKRKKKRVTLKNKITKWLCVLFIELR